MLLELGRGDSFNIVRVVTAGEDTAGLMTIDTGLGAGTHTLSVMILSTAGVYKTTNQIITQSAGVVTIADGAVVLAATDIVHLIAKR